MEKKKNCRYVQDVERFFGSEFSTAQLIEAVEEMTVVAKKSENGGIKSDPKTVALGVLAACKIRELYDDTYYHPYATPENYYSQENIRNQSYKIGLDIVSGKYDNISQAIRAYEKVI